MSPAEFIERALSVPFADHGSGWDGWSCWGLCRAWYREVLGIDLPAHDVGYETAGETRQDRAAIGVMVEAERVAWQSVDRPIMGDLLLLRCHARPIHVGVMVDRARFLHAEKKIGTVIERVSSPIWSRRIEGVYRHADA